MDDAIVQNEAGSKSEAGFKIHFQNCKKRGLGVQQQLPFYLYFDTPANYFCTKPWLNDEHKCDVKVREPASMCVRSF